MIHRTNGNRNEERLVNIIDGTVIETKSDKIKIKVIIEMGQEKEHSDMLLILF